MGNKRILFVDDEPLVLQGLQRMLRARRHEWDMEFVENAAQALARMAQMPFDVVISDMLMPGMNGAQLLAQVMHRHPRTVRIILSGHADKQLNLQCIGSTHLYLSKPCDSDALQAVVHRATNLDYLRQHEHLQALVGKMEHVPTIPALYVAIVRALNDPQTSIEEIGEVVACDIGMTSRMLKLVNSAFFGLARPLSHPAEAVSHLGLDTVKSLALAIGTFGQLSLHSQSNARIDQIWNHSMATSICSKLIAKEERAALKQQDEAFVSGLLHDIGKLVLIINLPAEDHRMLALARTKNFTERQAEREVFGADHAEVGGYLLGLWGLPVPVVEAVALHHEPALSRTRIFTPLTAVHVANALVHGLPASEPATHPDANSLLDTDYLEEIGALERVEAWNSAWQHTRQAAANS